MKILFLIYQPNRVKNFDFLVRSLSERGHEVRLTYATAPEGVEHLLGLPGVNALSCPTQRCDVWQHFVPSLRQIRDYCRYLEPCYDHVTDLRARAGNELNEWFIRLSHWGWFSGRRLWWEKTLKFIEDLIPSDPGIDAFLSSKKPDLVLVTPLVQAGASYQTDYVKSCHRLGIPVLFLPYSWDNLSNKGLIRAMPDKILVWNEIQRQEAVEMHGAPAEAVEICGAWRFDEFFAMVPRVDRETFCQKVGLDSREPFILYLGSSETTTPDENRFILRWLKSLRAAEDPVLRSCGILIRHYPGRGPELAPLRLGRFINVSTDDPKPFCGGLTPGLYESLRHCAAVVGINTSGMLEAAIMGKPVHTVLAQEFYGGQEGTVHFHYLTRTGGGLLHVAKDLAEHVKELSSSMVLSGKDPKSARFVQGFLRPFGVGEPCIPVVLDKLETAARSPKQPLAAGVLRKIIGLFVLPFGAAIAFCVHYRHYKRLRMWRAAWWEYFRGKFYGLFKRRILGVREGAQDATMLPTVRLDYADREIFIYATSDMERKWRARSCRKEPWTVKWLERHYKGDGILYDIGANVGTFTLIAASLAEGKSNARVYSFEPGFASFARLCDNIVLNRCADRVVPVPVPLSSATQVGAFKYKDLEPGQSRHRFDPVLAETGTKASRQYLQPVFAFKLDELRALFRLPPPNHIKLDVDGGELEVLRGARETLNEPSMKTLLAEIEGRLTAEVTELLSSLGYALVEKYQRVGGDGSPKRSWYGLFSRKPSPMRGGTPSAASLATVAR